MKYLTLTLAFMLVLYTSPAIAYQSGSEDPGSEDPGTGDPGTSTTWTFTSPDDGSENYGEVLFAGTGPTDSLGALSVYSYSNSSAGTVLAFELQLQMSVIVDTDPGIDWVGPVFGTPGESYATIMPAVGAPNVGLLTMLGHGGVAGVGVDLVTLALLGGGDSVLFRIVEP